MPEQHNQDRSYDLAKEKHKTFRWAIFVGAFVVLGGVALLLGKNVDINIKEGKLTASKPILEQIDQPTHVDPKTGITYTAAKVSDEAENKIKQLSNVDPNRFSGKNYINNVYGYLFTSDHPDKWNITYQPSNYNTNEPINYINGGNGIEFKVLASENDEQISLQQLVETLTLGSAMVNGQVPEVTYDSDGRTAFFRTYVKQFDKQALMKVIVTPSRGYIAAVYYPQSGADQATVEEFEKMAASFTLFQDS